MEHSSRTRTVRRVILAIVLVPAFAFALGEAFGWPFLRGPLETFLAQRLERPVRITAPFRLRLLGSLRMQAGALWVAAPPGFDAPHLVEADELRLKLRYRDLLDLRSSGALRIAAIDVGRIDARLERQADGSATWQVRAPDESQTRAPPPTVDRLTVRDGVIELDDPTAGTSLKTVFATNEGGEQTTPTSRASVAGQLRRHKLDGEVTAAGFLSLAARDEDATAVPVRGRIDYGGVHVEFDGAAADLFGARDLKGNVTARGASLGVLGELFNVLLPTTDPFRLQGTLEKDGDLWRAHVTDARVGSSAINGQFSYDARPTRPRLEGELGGKRLHLADLAPAFGTRNPDGTRAVPPPGRVIPDRDLNLPSLKTMDARVAVNLDHVDLGSAFSQPIAPLRATLTLEAGRLVLGGIDASTAKGRLRGEIAIDADRRHPQWVANLGWEGIHLEDWIGASQARNEAAGSKGDGSTQAPYFTGVLHGRAKVTGHGRSTAALLGSLDGEITAGVRQGSISHLLVEIMGLDVAQGLGLVLTGDQTLPVDCAVADIVARDGQLVPRVALFDTPVTLVIVDGKVDLRGETLDLRLVAEPRNVSPFTLRTPVRVTGTFDEPRTAPEGGPLARKALSGIALGLISPLAAILPFIDLGENPGEPCREALAKLRR